MFVDHFPGVREQTNPNHVIKTVPSQSHWGRNNNLILFESEKENVVLLLGVPFPAVMAPDTPLANFYHIEGKTARIGSH